MRIYRVQITGDKYPTECIVQGGSWQGAISAAIREWKKRFKGSKTNELRIRAIKGGELIIAKNGND